MNKAERATPWNIFLSLAGNVAYVDGLNGLNGNLPKAQELASKETVYVGIEDQKYLGDIAKLRKIIPQTPIVVISDDKIIRSEAKNFENVAAVSQDEILASVLSR